MASEQVRRSLARNLTHLMQTNDLTECDIAYRLNVTQGAVNRWKHGISCPRGDSLVKLANIFGVTTAMLLKENEETPSCVALDDDTHLLHVYHTLTPKAKQKAVSYILDLAHQSWSERNDDIVVNLL